MRIFDVCSFKLEGEVENSDDLGEVNFPHFNILEYPIYMHYIYIVDLKEFTNLFIIIMR